MPIKKYIPSGVVFTPETLSSLSEALASTAEILDIRNDEKKCQTVAKFLLRLAAEDDSLDAAALRARAVAELSGVARDRGKR